MPSSTILSGDDDSSQVLADPPPDATAEQHHHQDDPYYETPQSSEIAPASAESALPPRSATSAAAAAAAAVTMAATASTTSLATRSGIGGGGGDGGGGGGTSRSRSMARKSEPTLLHDFLLGRPSAARIAAEKKRRESVEALKAELRHEMKQSQVRKLQPPNGVKARVKAWQKANAAAATASDAAPDDAASEPTDLAFEEEDFRSVTEEDRIRIKMRQKKREPRSKPPTNRSESNLLDDSDAKSRVPRKRIVSDDHWVKPKARKVSIRKVSPRPRRAATPPRMSQPRMTQTSFAFRNTPNPSASSKVKAWAKNVEAAPPPRSIISSIRSLDSLREEADRRERERDRDRDRQRHSHRRLHRDDQDRRTDVHDDNDEEVAVVVVEEEEDEEEEEGEEEEEEEEGEAREEDEDEEEEEVTIHVDDMASRLTQGQSLKTGEDYESEIRITVTRTNSKRGGNGNDRAHGGNGDGHEDDDDSRSGSERATSVTASETETRSASRDDGEDLDLLRVTTINESSARDMSSVRGSSARETWLESSELDLRPPKPLDDDAIEVKPLSPVGSEISTPRPQRAPLLRSRSKTTSAPSSSSTILENLIKAVEEATELSRLTDDPDAHYGHREPTVKRRRSRSQPATKRSSAAQPRKNSVDQESALSDDVTIYSANHPPSLMDRSVADISGEIPFGHSAFSELELPMREPSNSKSKAKQKQKKNDKNSSMRGMPNMLKKVVEEGKKMLHDMNEPPRNLAPNNPPSIEKWLSTTVEMIEADASAAAAPKPFDDIDDDHDNRPATITKPPADVSKPPHRKSSQETRRSTKTRSSAAPSAKTASSNTDVTIRESTTAPASAEASTPKATKSTPRTSPKSSSQRTSSATPKRMKSQTSNPGLRRSRATRSSSSLRSAGKRPLLGVLKEAFQGESSGDLQPSGGSYRSHEEREYAPEEDLEEADLDSQYTHSVSDMTSWQDSTSRSGLESESFGRLHPESGRSHSESSRLAPPRFRPPTSGSHELSTIMSDEDDGPAGSGGTTASDDTQSTVTRTTTVTKKTASTARTPQRQDSGGGLRRRLTKHSDLVSVLSTPDDSRIPERIRSNRSRPSLRRARRVSADVTNDDLLREFADDEYLYQRELKTLVDGVIPVLLNHVMGNMTGSELFGPSAARQRVESMSQAVVNMGVCLDKLKHGHKKAPTTDLRKLAHWAHGVVPTYNNYLAAWRLGFQDLIVNLAPRGDEPDDEDSLLNLLPRNEIGDLLNADGERVAVAYLLKRPLIRIKQMSKLMQCVDSIYDTPDTADLRRDFEALQEKSRRRHREEVARLVDEEAIATDKTRARDLRTLDGAKLVTIDASRQVNAKDVFSLDLVHSNGQRLECRVELVHRDKQDNPKDDGDLLIREVGDGNRTYLLFPPISMTLISARAGNGELDMVVMIRGSHSGKSWYELLTLYADEEDQIADWLQILPPSPIPARVPEPSVLDDSGAEETDPFGDPGAPIGTQSVGHHHLLQKGKGESRGQGKGKGKGKGRDVEREREREERGRGDEDDDDIDDNNTERERGSRSASRKSSQSLERLATPISEVNESSSSPPPPSKSPVVDVERKDKTDPEEKEVSEWQIGDDAPPLRGPSVKEDMRRDHGGAKKGANAGGSGGPWKGADGAPPPPIHRTLSSAPPQQQQQQQQQQQKTKSQTLKPPVELYGGGLRRRTSSPLKHEYLPSDVSSPAMSELSVSEPSSETEAEDLRDGEDEEDDEEEEEEVEEKRRRRVRKGRAARHEEEDDEDDEDRYDDEEEEESDIDSSEDEFDSLDEIPQTEIGFSIRKGIEKRHSMVASECSLTPSNSASQAGLHGHKSQPEERNRFLASISMWTESGAWRDVSSDQCSVIVSDGLVEAFAHCDEGGRPLLALDLTPLVLIRQSTSVDLEVRSSLQSHCKFAQRHQGGNFRFRCLNTPDCYNLYMMVHHARLHNRKFIQLENESRFRSFGERRRGGGGEHDRDEGSGGGGGSGGGDNKRRSWFGRRNSYRSSVRAPAQSNDGVSSTPSSASATSFLRRLTLVGNFSFNLARSSVNTSAKHSLPGPSARNSIYTTNSGSSSSDSAGTTPGPRSPSASPSHNPNHSNNNSNNDNNLHALTSASSTENLRIRLHLLVSATKWEDHGNCTLQIRRPPPGWRQALRADLGLEKRVTVTTIPKKRSGDKPAVLLDAVLGSGCFSPMGTRGIVCGIWEELRDHKGAVGRAPERGPTGGNIKKWCFQFGTVGEANWVLRLVHQEVMTV